MISLLHFHLERPAQKSSCPSLGPDLDLLQTVNVQK